MTQLSERLARTAAIGALLAACAFGFSACHGKSSEPKGQVLATYDGEEITQREVSAELAGFNFTDDKARKAGEQAALQAVLNRHILANQVAKFKAVRHGLGWIIHF